MAVVTLNLNNKGNKGRRLPRVVKVIFFDYLAKILGTELQNYLKTVNSNNVIVLNQNKGISGIKSSNRDKNIEFAHKKSNLIHLSSNHIGENATPIMSKHKEINETSSNNESNQYLPQRSEETILNNSNFNQSTNKAKYRSDGILLKSRKDSFLKSLECDKSYFNILNNYDTNNNLHMQSNMENLYSSHRISSPVLAPCTRKLSCECDRNCANVSKKSKHSSNKVKNDVDLNFNLINQAPINNEIVLDSKGNSFLIKNNNSEHQRNSSTNHFCPCQLKNELSKNHKRKKSLLNNSFQANFLLELDKTLEKQFRPLVFSVNSTILKNEKRQDEKILIDRIQGEWQDLALVCDHFLCYFFPLMTLTVCLLIFVNSPHVFSQW
jgi:hypothetical protein